MLKNLQITVINPKTTAEKLGWGKISVSLCSTEFQYIPQFILRIIKKLIVKVENKDKRGPENVRITPRKSIFTNSNSNKYELLGSVMAGQNVDIPRPNRSKFLQLP